MVIKKIKKNNQDSNFWMFHRVRIENNVISDIYDQRGMLHTYEKIIDLINTALNNGQKFGSISQALKDKNIIHLTFDDGYKEHLIVAKKLKKKYHFLREDITFSINVRNSFYPQKLSMDLIYKLIDKNKLSQLDKVFNKRISDIGEIKNKIFKSKNYINTLNTLDINLDNYYLNESEIIQLSELFSITSHCVNHCYLTTLNETDIAYELKESKIFLENILNTSIDTICYPDGKNNFIIRKLSKESGYQYGLSISSNKSHYKIGRKIP